MSFYKINQISQNLILQNFSSVRIVNLAYLTLPLSSRQSTLFFKRAKSPPLAYPKTP